ncbi:MAG: amidase family protein [Thermoanaerobaculia bacterium]
MSVSPFATLAELGEALRKREISSLELTRFYLDRLEKHGDALGAVVTVTRERAESEARRADAEIAKGKWRGPLHGIPYGVKDLLATKGIPTTSAGGQSFGVLNSTSGRLRSWSFRNRNLRARHAWPSRNRNQKLRPLLLCAPPVSAP